MLPLVRSLKVLALHGKGNNGPSFAKRLAPLVEEMGPSCDWTFATAPHAAGNEGGFAWWTLPPGTRSFEAAEFGGIGESLDLLEGLWATEGPFDAVLGHSQGAMLTGILVGLASLDETAVFRPECAVLTGAAWPNPYTEMLHGLSQTEKVDIPTLHCWGLADTMNPPELAEKLKGCFGSEAQSLVHDGGHVVPLEASSKARIASFLAHKV